MIVPRKSEGLRYGHGYLDNCRANCVDLATSHLKTTDFGFLNLGMIAWTCISPRIG